jgi:2-polyprenyl-3-methyl-5-hydroxy-6-metoxy-1,4-benzoquinol methylase
MPGLETKLHSQALRALSRVNALSLTVLRIWREIRALAGHGPRPLRVLDVACGGGDVAVALQARALREGIALEASGCDLSPLALEHARARARTRGVDVNFFQLDVGASPLPRGFNLVCSSLFLHHLRDEEAVELLVRMAESGESVLVQDLIRSRLGYALAYGTLRAVSRSPVARVDGPRSVQSAFRLEEVEVLASRAGLTGARVSRCWPQRFALVWRRV